MTEERLRKFATEIYLLIVGPINPEQGERLGKCIRKELDREYRRGYVAGLREGRISEDGKPKL